MEKHSGDTPFNRFLAYWGGILAFAIFAMALIVLMTMMRGCSTEPSTFTKEEIEKRDTWARTAKQEQEALVGEAAWKNNDDGTFSVPADVAVSKMVETLKKRKQIKSSVPVEGAAVPADGTAEGGAN